MIIGILGLINAGKSTVANILVEEHNFVKVSFASSLKDAVAAIFRWPPELLQGDTEQSRHWREQPDSYWSNVMQKPITPRWVLQHVGTDIMRNHFDQNIWVHSLLKKLHNNSDKNYVISDVRFINEIDVILNNHGQIWEVQRTPLPPWCQSNRFVNFEEMSEYMGVHYPAIHASEWNWQLSKRDHIIQNDSTFLALKAKIANIINTTDLS